MSFTIAIPTYNRLPLLRQSLACAQAQLDGDCRVLVVDNGSSDGTFEWLMPQATAVQVLRNQVNQGSPAAFRQCLEAADGEFFSWLQDDDLLHPDFLKRARAAFAQYPQAAVYIAYAAASPTRCNLQGAYLMGPPLELDFAAAQTLRLIQGDALIPLSYFCSVGIPPVLVYRREALLQAIDRWNPKYSLYAERSVLNQVLRQGPAVVDAFVGGLFFGHEGQEYKRLFQLPGVEEDWLHMARETEEHLRQLPHWREQVSELFSGFSATRVHHWPGEIPSQGQGLAGYQWLREALQTRFPQERPAPTLKSRLRQWVPPVLWELASRWKSR